MTKFHRLSLTTRLVLAFIVGSLVGACIGGAGMFGMWRTQTTAQQLYDLDLLGLSHIKEANINLIYAGRARANYMLAHTPAERDEQLKVYRESERVMLDYLNKVRPMLHKPEGRQRLAEVEQAIAAWQPLVNRFFEAAQKRAPGVMDDELRAIGLEVRKASGLVDDALTAFARTKESVAAGSAKQARDLYQSLQWLLIAMASVGAVSGVAFGFWLARSIGRQLGGEPHYAADIAHRVAEGDLTAPILLRDGDDSSLLHALKTMQTQLGQIVARIRESAENIAGASSQIAQGNLDLSSRTEQQASSLQQTAASMEQLTSTVGQNAEGARRGNELAMEARTVAGRGGEVVRQVVATMTDISNSSHKVTDIIGVIDSIAFQTNILALNAAVEAARAGDSGRGFAVVASEVRALAQRSAEAAREIKGLITASLERVDHGAQMVGEAGTTMTGVVDAIRRVTDIMGEISTASDQQRGGIEQVSEAVSQMDRVTQQNAALVEEAAAAADSLQNQARRMLEAVSVFRIPEQTRVAASA